MKKILIVVALCMLVFAGCTSTNIADINQAGIARCDSLDGQWVFSGRDLMNAPMTLCLIDDRYVELQGWE